MATIIDISRHNIDDGKHVDFAKLSRIPDLYVIIRIQYGSNGPDTAAEYFINECRKYGIEFGVYAYGCFVGESDAIMESNDFWNRSPKDATTFILDSEDDTVDACGAENVAKCSQVFIDNLKRLGAQKVGFYVANHMLLDGDPMGLLNVRADFRWIPRYGSNDGQPHEKPDFPCDLWQYTDKGRIEGIDGDVDLNALNGDKPLSYFTGTQDNTVQGSSAAIILPADWQTNNLGFITVTADNANIRREPNLNSEVVRSAEKGSGHVYLDWRYDGERFWYKVAEDNWMSEKVCVINKDGKTRGVVWVSGTGVNVRKGASTGDEVVEQITHKGAYDAWYRYGDWIYINNGGLKGGWILFDPDYVKWIR